MKISLADNWRDLHKRGTVIVSAALAAVTAIGPSLLDTWNMIPPDLKAALPEGTARWVSTASFVLILIVRYTTVRRTPKDDRHE